MTLGIVLYISIHGNKKSQHLGRRDLKNNDTTSSDSPYGTTHLLTLMMPIYNAEYILEAHALPSSF